MTRFQIPTCLTPIHALVLALLAQPGSAATHLAISEGALADAPSAGATDSAAPAIAPETPSDRGLEPPALMLAQVYEPGVDVSGYWVSEKLDGVRAYWDGTHLVSRGGHRIRAPAWFVAGFPAEPLDGELWMGRGRFEELSGTVRRLEPEEDAWREVRYLVFDLPTLPQPFGARLDRLGELVREANNPRLALVEQARVQDTAALMARLDAVVGSGGEGLMLHRGGSLYRAGRSPDLLKLKPYQDAEARVVGHIQGKGKYLGMLGALEVEDGEGRRFRIGTGFTDAERRAPPPLGSRVTFQYRGRTEDGIPRFASFLRVDPEWGNGKAAPPAMPADRNPPRQ
jgi:DNA ligase-1